MSPVCAVPLVGDGPYPTPSAKTEQYSELIRAGDADGIMDLLTDKWVRCGRGGQGHGGRTGWAQAAMRGHMAAWG